MLGRFLAKIVLGKVLLPGLVRMGGSSDTRHGTLAVAGAQARRPLEAKSQSSPPPQPPNRSPNATPRRKAGFLRISYRATGQKSSDLKFPKAPRQNSKRLQKLTKGDRGGPLEEGISKRRQPPSCTFGRTSACQKALPNPAWTMERKVQRKSDSMSFLQSRVVTVLVTHEKLLISVYIRLVYSCEEVANLSVAASLNHVSQRAGDCPLATKQNPHTMGEVQCAR
eukprot:6081199-Amphidinium_carterae.1